ncbi:hypothetical protein N3K66_003055 [Trichothecium roseum]|uniref:Uncharacterized protein n=1 Tax=Trichothecium roseum TaxID=47278 RepID=A0ACC0V4E2_9HYPO|nr:hypothetical protein N3K66_003055 [Trichothecium roseum]
MEEFNGYVIKWQPLTSRLEAAADDAHAAHAKLPPAPSREETRACLRRVYSRLRSSLGVGSSDGGGLVPGHLTSPPVRDLHILLLNGQTAGGACPCCLPDVLASVEVHGETGVTGDDVLRELAGYLYGHGSGDDDDDGSDGKGDEAVPPPQIYEPDGSAVAREGWVVYRSDWISTGEDGGGGGGGGALAQFDDWGSGYEVIKLFLYCCPVEDLPWVRG